MTQPTKPEIQFSLEISPEESVSMLTAVIGAGDPAILITTEPNEDNSVVLFRLRTGYPFEQSAEGVEDIADILDLIVESLRSQEFADKFSEALSEEAVRS